MKCIFVALHVLFNYQYPISVTKIEQSNFIENAKKKSVNSVKKKSVNSVTDHMMSDKKDTVLLDIIAQFFKIRVHQKCKIILEKFRRKEVGSQKQKSLPSKLKN